MSRITWGLFTKTLILLGLYRPDRSDRSTSAGAKFGCQQLSSSSLVISTELINNFSIGSHILFNRYRVHIAGLLYAAFWIATSSSYLFSFHLFFIYGAQTQVINQDETPRLYSLVFGEGVVNDATAVVLFNAIKNLNIGQLKGGVVLKVIADFLYLFATSTILGISVRTRFLPYLNCSLYSVVA